MSPSPADPNAFAQPLADMEAHIKAAEERGEELPAQAYALVARLRALVTALEELNGMLAPLKPSPDSEQRPPDDAGPAVAGPAPND